MDAASSTAIVAKRRIKQSTRHLWPLYGELTAMMVVFGVFIAQYGK